ncbi:aminopeptidase N, partial [Salmonella enterica subsp. enterica serovar Newport]|nr:aminopeptidase N [Salmonella enterica subsp. enterica serovar Newport]
EVRALRAHQFPEDQGPLAHPVRPRRYREINNFYTSTVYEKGSEIVRMLRVMLGDEIYRKAMDLHFERHDGEAATVDDFLAVFADASGRDLSQFALWYHQSGTPHLSIATNYDARRRSFTIDIEQTIAPTRSEGRKRAMHIPLAFGLVGPNGADMDYHVEDGAVVADGVFHLRKRRQSVTLTGVGAEPMLSINRGFSAPVTIALESGRHGHAFLARHDSDPFNRWQALNDMATAELVDATRDVRGDKTPDFSDTLIEL